MDFQQMVVERKLQEVARILVLQHMVLHKVLHKELALVLRLPRALFLHDVVYHDDSYDAFSHNLLCREQKRWL